MNISNYEKQPGFKESIVNAAKTHNVMNKAAASLGLSPKTFKKYALKYGVYDTSQSYSEGNYTRGFAAIPLEEILEGKHPGYNSTNLKRRLFNECVKEKKCEECGLTEWNEKPIPLELHHIDSCRSNHKLENLQIICPNCHAQSALYRGNKLTVNGEIIYEKTGIKPMHKRD
jgi:hypothetical protein